MKKIFLTILISNIFMNFSFAQTFEDKAKRIKENNQEKSTAHYLQPAESNFLVSSLINASVKNLKDEIIGQIKDIIIYNNQVKGIVLSIGHFLGEKERYVVVDPLSINIKQNNASWNIRIDTSKKNLENAPEFKYTGRWGL